LKKEHELEERTRKGGDSMKHLYASLTAVLAFVVFAPVSALAQQTQLLPNTWVDRIELAGARFLPVLTGYPEQGYAIQDQETGLVWEQAPPIGNNYNWGGAVFRCMNLIVGNRKGFRLPTDSELASLVDKTQHDPTLPSGHPFPNVTSDFYWTATTSTDPAVAVGVQFSNGFVYGFNKNALEACWCVRGGRGTDVR
jgi:hypothetical protein